VGKTWPTYTHRNTDIDFLYSPVKYINFIERKCCSVRQCVRIWTPESNVQDVRNGCTAQPNDTRTIYCMTNSTLKQSIFSSTPGCTSRFPHNEWALAQYMTGVDIDKCPSMDLAPVAIPEWHRKAQAISVYECLSCNAPKVQNDRERLRHKTKCSGSLLWFFNITKMT
jgi:hypothetical protein